MILCIAILVQFMLPHSKPAVELPYFALLKSTVNLIRTYPQLRESAFLGASLFCCFSAFWTTLVFLLETPPYHYGSQAAGLFGLWARPEPQAHRSSGASPISTARDSPSAPRC